MITDYRGREIYTGMDFVNVKAYGATGDGETDDYASIQNAFNSIRYTGGTVFFPAGVYKVSAQIIVHSNTRVDFNGSTLLQGGNINNLLMGYCTVDIGGYDGPHDIVIENGTFDGGSYTTNNTLVGFCHAKNITIRNCHFVNAYGEWHDMEINSSKYVLIDNCTFEGARKTSDHGEMIQFQAYSNHSGWPWSNGAPDGTICKMCEIRGCHFYDGVIAPAIGNHGGAEKYIKIHDCTFEDCVSTRGVIDFDGGNLIYAYDNTFIGCVTPLGTGVTGYNNLVDTTLQ